MFVFLASRVARFVNETKVGCPKMLSGKKGRPTDIGNLGPIVNFSTIKRSPFRNVLDIEDEATLIVSKTNIRMRSAEMVAASIIRIHCLVLMKF